MEEALINDTQSGCLANPAAVFDSVAKETMLGIVVILQRIDRTELLVFRERLLYVTGARHQTRSCAISQSLDREGSRLGGGRGKDYQVWSSHAHL